MTKYKILLKEYLVSSEIFKNKINNLPLEILDFRPTIIDAWTIREHCIHVVDSEINNFIRLKSIIAQPFESCFVINEEQWTKNLNYKREDIDKYLRVFCLLRQLMYEFLIDEPTENWNTGYYIWTCKGNTSQVTIEKGIELYIKHLAFHLEYIDRNIKEYKKNR